MTKPLTVVATLKARKGCEEALYQELRKLIAPTLAEEGCINYDMHRSVDDPSVFVFYENWTTRPLWERHMNSPHLQAFSARQGELADSWELFTGERV
jgi:quinol monooxygenase YgiN